MSNFLTEECDMCAFFRPFCEQFKKDEPQANRYAWSHAKCMSFRYMLHQSEQIYQYKHNVYSSIPD